MGIVNVTPDSFSDGGRYLDADSAVAHGRALRAAGAGLLDVGGESTRPGAARVDPDIERARVLPVVAALTADGAVVSIDTMNAATARAAVDAGARIVNDVSGGLADADMLPVVAASGADVVLQHWRGHSADMYSDADYGDVARDLTVELGDRIRAAAAAGATPTPPAAAALSWTKCNACWRTASARSCRAESNVRSASRTGKKPASPSS